jgi:hypothetical protein
MTERCSSGSISTLAAKRARSSVEGLAEAWLGQEQKIVRLSAHDHDRSDHARLRRQEQRLAGSGRDIVREHPLEEVLGVRPGDAHKLPQAGGDSARNGSHAQ